MKKYSREEHKNGLLEIYAEHFLKATGGGFYMHIYDLAMLKLKADVDPKKVEKWVIDITRLWTKLL